MLIGFAAETQNLMENARAKLQRKHLDAIVLNDVSRPGLGFGSDRNAGEIITADEADGDSGDEQVGDGRAHAGRGGEAARPPADSEGDRISMRKRCLDEESRKAVAATVRYYRELGIYDLYRREVPEGMSFGQAIEREELAAIGEGSPAAEALTVDAAASAAVRCRCRATCGDPRRQARCPARDSRRDWRLHALPAVPGAHQIVFGVGDPHARIMFVGEGPGADEDAQGEPFVGRAGQLLNNMITAMGIRREDVYIANVVKCRPPKNRTPERDECETCGPFLMRQIAVVRPEIIVALGATAAKFLLGATDSMANLRGQIYDFHPALHRQRTAHGSGARS